MMDIDTTDLTPWPEINRTLNNMRHLVVRVGNAEYSGAATLTLSEEDGTAVLAFTPPPAPRPRKAAAE